MALTAIEPVLGDVITIRRVANGWVIQPGREGTNEFTHVAQTSHEVADHVLRWAEATAPSRVR